MSMTSVRRVAIQKVPRTGETHLELKSSEPEDAQGAKERANLKSHEGDKECKHEHASELHGALIFPEMHASSEFSGAGVIETFDK